LLNGLIDVREVKSNSLMAAVTNAPRHHEPVRARSEDPERQSLGFECQPRGCDGAARTPKSSTHDGKGLGDIELTGRYQLTRRGADKPYYIASLRFKTRTGKDPIEVEVDRTYDLTTAENRTTDRNTDRLGLLFRSSPASPSWCRRTRSSSSAGGS